MRNTCEAEPEFGEEEVSVRIAAAERGEAPLSMYADGTVCGDGEEEESTQLRDPGGVGHGSGTVRSAPDHGPVKPLPASITPCECGSWNVRHPGQQ